MEQSKIISTGSQLLNLKIIVYYEKAQGTIRCSWAFLSLFFGYISKLINLAIEQ